MVHHHRHHCGRQGGLQQEQHYQQVGDGSDDEWIDVIPNVISDDDDDDDHHPYHHHKHCFRQRRYRRQIVLSFMGMSLVAAAAAAVSIATICRPAVSIQFVEAFSVSVTTPSSPSLSSLALSLRTSTFAGTKSKRKRSRPGSEHCSTLSSDAVATAKTSSSSSDIDVVCLEWTELFTPSESAARTTATTATTPVVFLHGLLGSKRNFASLATMLGVQLQTPRRIYGVDLRNHGENAQHIHNNGCMLYPHMARDVVGFLDRLNIDKCIVVGHSMGGKVGQALSLLYPERVEGLVVIDIAPVAYTRSNNPNWKAVEDILMALKETCDVDDDNNVQGGGNNNANSEELSGLTKQQVDKALRPAIPDPALRAFVLTNYDSHRCKWKIPIRTLVDELENIAGFDLVINTNHDGDHVIDSSSDGTHQQHQYDGDVFIIHGGQSKFVRHAYMDTIAQYFPNHLLTTIRGAGHWVHAEAPDDTVALLKRFLDR